MVKRQAFFQPKFERKALTFLNQQTIQSHMSKEQLADFWKKSFNFKEAELRAFQEVDRKLFVEEKHKAQAYEDHPLPIKRGKTISQPTTVMFMTSLLEIEPEDKVFEVGTGSGYQTAILAKLAKKVISTEVIPELVHFAKDNLKKANIENAEVIEAEGSKGYEHDCCWL
jgi:protein-L-isoaspartate(D-aspartate) O-methyltransferase